MKQNWILEKGGVHTPVKEVESSVMDVLKSLDYKRKDVETLTYYYKSEDGKVYFVARTKSGKDVEGCI